MVAGLAIGALALLAGTVPTVADDPILSGLRGCAPASYGAAVQCLDRVMPPADRAAMAERDGPYRFFIGIFILKNWGLSDGSGPLYDEMRALGYAEPAAMTEAILEGYAARYRAASGDRR
jgi:hypothetical protein